jgi:hypothetical protein
MAKVERAKWKSAPQAHDYPAATHYLSLLADPTTVAAVVGQLQSASTVEYLAKDLLRASELPLLKETNAHVASDLKKIAKGTSLSPVLLVRGDHASARPLVVADGYHRICASYWLDENTPIPCRIATWP